MADENWATLPRIKLTLCALTVALSTSLAWGGAPARAANQSPKQLLGVLVAQANREGSLTATVQSSWSRVMLPSLIEAFKKRFDLHINVTATPIASARQFPIEIAATKAGAPPTYDVMQGDDAETIQLIGAGGVESIPNWKELLEAVNPLVSSGKVHPDQISRGPFQGRSFLYMANIKEIVYNPKLIKAADLPKTHVELANPKYRGLFVQPPWTSHWEVAPEVFNPSEREKFLAVVRAAGKNGTVLPENEAVQRVVLGQYDFALAQDAYVRQTLSKDPKAPIADAFFTDYNELNGVYYSVRHGTRSPAAAALWALWLTTPQAEKIWQPSNQSFQPYGESKIDAAERAEVKKFHAPIIGYLDNDTTVALLKWQQTSDGAHYLAALAKAIQGE